MKKMVTKGYYGVVVLNREEFMSIPSSMLITGCTDTVKYMCANDEEEEFLTSLGVSVSEGCDWYKCMLEVI